MTVSSENQFYLELGIIKGWALFFEKEIPERVKQAIRQLEDLGLGVIGKSEEQLREEVEAQSYLLNDALNDIEDLKQLGSFNTRLADNPEFKREVRPEIKEERDQAWEEPEQTVTAKAPQKSTSISDDQVEEIRRLAESMTDEEIGTHLGVSRDTVIRFRAKHGIEKNRGPREGVPRSNYQWEPWQKQKLIEMKQAGASYAEIGKAIGKTASQCSGIWFWEKKKLEKRGEPNSSDQELDRPMEETSVDGGVTAISPAARWKPSPLSPDDWSDIQKMLVSGQSRESIASDYDIPVEDLDAFVASHLKRAEAKSPLGEARALSTVGSAT
ncbi:helix-turn-helix transcriptional regulator [Fimbriiglobus ruber]|uniref:Uncharacterized protein n=1 Tax=Fimbriiglobus ruber TaxID=1908690 RepID=A0A225DD31_9BACT|nr:hypothetical protein [Fimbriiglobus ruber]OWK39470.1 hypothetical protein FRUB_06033 [Fimbriiglobus ruber]